LTISELEAVIEAILFANGDSVSVKSIAAATDMDVRTVNSVINNLADRYEAEKRGINIIQVGEGFQMCTSPKYYDYVKRVFQTPPKKTLSNTLLETLAIVAYKQPITKGQIEEIRGVNADHAVNKLVEYGLVSECGRLDAPGRPILLGTTDEFLRFFGFKSLEYLPDSSADEKQLRLEAEEEVGSFTSS
jgi:segregation and condensation protein B